MNCMWCKSAAQVLQRSCLNRKTHRDAHTEKKRNTCPVSQHLRVVVFSESSGVALKVALHVLQTSRHGSESKLQATIINSTNHGMHARICSTAPQDVCEASSAQGRRTTWNLPVFDRYGGAPRHAGITPAPFIAASASCSLFRTLRRRVESCSSSAAAL